MRVISIFALIIVLFATSCYGLRSNKLADEKNEVNDTNSIVGGEDYRRLQTLENTVDKGDETKTGGENKTKHPTADSTDQQATHTPQFMDANQEERGLGFSKLANLLQKSKISTSFKASSQKNIASDSLIAAAQNNPTSSKLMGVLGKSSPTLTKKDASYLKSNPVFGKLGALFRKSPTKLTKNDVNMMQKSPSYNKAKALLGKDPATASKKDFDRVGTYLSKNRDDPDLYWDIFNGILIMIALGAIASIAFVGL